MADVVPAQITIGGIQRVLQNLLGERVSIRDLPTILEGISEACGFTRNITAITEHVRTRLARQICEPTPTTTGFIPLTLSPEWEQAFAEAMVGEARTSSLPWRRRACRNSSPGASDLRAARHDGRDAGAADQPGVRPLCAVDHRAVPSATTVMSQNEIHPKAKI